MLREQLFLRRKCCKELRTHFRYRLQNIQVQFLGMNELMELIAECIPVAEKTQFCPYQFPFFQSNCSEMPMVVLCRHMPLWSKDTNSSLTALIFSNGYQLGNNARPATPFCTIWITEMTRTRQQCANACAATKNRSDPPEKRNAATCITSTRTFLITVRALLHLAVILLQQH